MVCPENIRVVTNIKQDLGDALRLKKTVFIRLFVHSLNSIVGQFNQSSFGHSVDFKVSSDKSIMQ